MTFEHAPRWVRDVLAGASVVLAFVGVVGAVVVDNEPKAKFVQVGETIGDQATATTTAKDAKFYAADSKFKVAFPGPPERSTEKVDVAPLSFELTSYLYENDDIAYAVLTSPYAAELPFDFESVADGAAEEIDGKVESQQETTFQGMRAVEIVISFDGGLVRQMVVRAPDRIVQLVVASDDDTATRFARFRDSLEIL